MTDQEFEVWVKSQREEVIQYLINQNIKKPNVGSWPAFDVTPYFAIWAVESKKVTGAIGWWAFSGDCPTDYISGEGIRHPRKALLKLIEQWSENIPYLEKSENPPNTILGKTEDGPKLAKLLAERINILKEWSEDNDLWTEN